MRQTFLWRIACELKLYKYRVLQESKEEILGNAFKIHTMISIYEELLEKSEYLDEEILKRMLYTKNILEYFYDLWMHTKDSYSKELSVCIDKGVKTILLQNGKGNIA